MIKNITCRVIKIQEKMVKRQKNTRLERGKMEITDHRGKNVHRVFSREFTCYIKRPTFDSPAVKIAVGHSSRRSGDLVTDSSRRTEQNRDNTRRYISLIPFSYSAWHREIVGKGAAAEFGSSNSVRANQRRRTGASHTRHLFPSSLSLFPGFLQPTGAHARW